MRFKGLDLNLLVAFNVLMETRSVSRAAEQLNLSQPAMSAALGRLRDYFGDDLLVLHEGAVVEHGPAAELFARPTHPVTARLLHAAERLAAGPRPATGWW